MKILIKILNKTIIAEYYRQNAIFIFAILMFSFGFLRAIEHQTIIKLTLKSHQLLAWVFIVWLAHAFKVILFSQRILQTKPYEFLYQIRLFAFPKRFLAFCWLQFSLIQLTFLYSLWMIKIGLEEERIFEVFLILSLNISLVLIGAIMTEMRIRKPNPNKVISNSVDSVFSKFRTPPYLFFIRYLFQKQPVLLLLTKFFGCFMLLGVCLLYPTDDYDNRLLAIGGLFVGAGSLVFVNEFHVFENKYLLFYRNLPMQNHQRVLFFSLQYFLLLIPEIIVLIRNLPSEISYLFAFQLIFYILSFTVFLHTINYIIVKNKESVGMKIFYAGILYFLLIMFKIPIILVAVFNFTFSHFVFKKHFYRHEYLV